MALAIFDLDNTLLAGDSDHRWGEFLCDVGLSNAEAFRQKNDAFYADYQAGRLDMTAYLDFVLEPLTGMARSAVRSLQRQFVAECIEPMLLDKAFDLLNEHRIKGDTLLMMTATHAVVAEPVAARLGLSTGSAAGWDSTMTATRAKLRQPASSRARSIISLIGEAGIPTSRIPMAPGFTPTHTTISRC